MIDGWAPVAEYKSVCFLEKGGTKRAVWKRREYATDGYIYLWERSPDGDESVTTYAVPNERIAKAFIDEMTEEQRKQFHSYKECGRILKMDRIEEITPPSLWDEKAGVFIHWDDLLDGAHRTSPLRVD